MWIAEIQKRVYHYWRAYGTLNNIVMAAALLIAASWVWGTISMIQTNFAAQKAVDEQARQLQLTQLQVDTLKYQQNYYNSDESKDLAAREDLGLASPGEKVLILPPNSAAVKQEDTEPVATAIIDSNTSTPTESNFDQWMNFLSGGAASSQDLQK